MKAVIETKRLLLRNFRLSDAESMFESYCHNENIITLSSRKIYNRFTRP